MEGKSSKRSPPYTSHLFACLLAWLHFGWYWKIPLLFLCQDEEAKKNYSFSAVTSSKKKKNQLSHQGGKICQNEIIYQFYHLRKNEIEKWKWWRVQDELLFWNNASAVLYFNLVLIDFFLYQQLTIACTKESHDTVAVVKKLCSSYHVLADFLSFNKLERRL